MRVKHNKKVRIWTPDNLHIYRVSRALNVALNTCIIYNVVKNTKESDNVDLKMVNLLD